MPSLAAIEGYRSSVGDLVTLSFADLEAFWAGLDPANATETVEAVRATLPELTGAYGEAAGSLAADFYDDLRFDEAVPGDFVARVAEPPPTERTDALARWSVGPLFGAEPDPALALTLLAGGLQKLVVGVGRVTIQDSSLADPEAEGWSRVPRPGACAFCRLMGSRGAVYGSQEAALVVGGGGRVRGSRGAGSSYHDLCGCVAAPAWPGREIERPDGTDETQAAYQASEARDLKGVLADMRQTLGAS